MSNLRTRDRLKAALRSLLGIRTYERLVFRYHLGYWPNYKRPKTFSEKIVYRKLFLHDERYVALSDKVAVRDYVQEKWGDEILTALYGVISKGKDAPFNMPRSFFAKATYGSGINRLITNYSPENWGELVRLLDEMLDSEHTYGRLSTQWWYEGIPKRILLEEVLRDSEDRLPPDFKFYCFDGVVKLIHVDFDRFGDHTRSYFDPDWKFLPYSTNYPQGSTMLPPKNLKKMIEVAETLGQGFDFVRVDLYSVDEERIVFGELTFAPDAGWVRFYPKQDYDWEVGELWKLDFQGN